MKKKVVVVSSLVMVKSIIKEAQIADVNVCIENEVIDADLPLLLSKEAMKKADIK